MWVAGIITQLEFDGCVLVSLTSDMSRVWVTLDEQSSKLRLLPMVITPEQQQQQQQQLWQPPTATQNSQNRSVSKPQPAPDNEILAGQWTVGVRKVGGPVTFYTLSCNRSIFAFWRHLWHNSEYTPTVPENKSQ